METDAKIAASEKSQFCAFTQLPKKAMMMCHKPIRKTYRDREFLYWYRQATRDL